MAILSPNPFQDHPEGSWEVRMRSRALAAIRDALARYRRGEASEAELRADKNVEGIKYWLWYMHHPDDNRWKNLGRPCWSLDAYLTWRRYYLQLPDHKRLDRQGLPAVASFPKKWAGEDALVHEHVVPQKALLDLLIRGDDPETVLSWNIGAVITKREDRRLPTSSHHPNPSDPWVRYAGTGIKFITNPRWTRAEREALQRHDLLFEGDLQAEIAASKRFPGSRMAATTQLGF